jgi:cephalosporin hydroxylase
VAIEYRRRYHMSLRKWLIYHQRHIVFDKCQWMGVTTLKNPLDAWIYQEILYETRPDVIVELGSAAGGSTLYLAHLCDLIGHGTVLSVDADRANFHAVHDRIVTVTGMTADAEVTRRVREQCEGRSVMVIHDADHRKEQVLSDLERYAPLVTAGNYLIIEDGIVDLFRPGNGLGTWTDGPLAATDEFLRTNPHFQVDSERERYLMTYNPRGFLRRVSEESVS